MILAFAFQAPETRRVFAANATEAIFMAPPQAVAPARLRDMAWVGDGGFLVVVRDEPESPPGVTTSKTGSELLVWSRQSGRTRSLMGFDRRLTTVSEILPMGGTDRFVLETTERVREGDALVSYSRISLVSAATGASVRLNSQREEPNWLLIHALPSSTRPIGILERIDATSKRIRVFGPDGRLGPEIAVERSSGLLIDAPGGSVQLRRGVDPKTGKGRTEARSFDLPTGRLGEWRPWKPQLEKEETPRLTTEDRATSGSPGVRVPCVLLVLKGGKPDEAGVVSTDGTRSLLSPKLDAVAYVDQGLVMVRTLAKVDRKAYDDSVRAALISETVVRAKQVAIGLAILAGDTDDVLPGQGVDINGLLGPYLKNDSLLRGFVYTFKGGPMTDIEDVSGTEIGHIDGPGGRAAIYADTSVRWVPDHKP